MPRRAVMATHVDLFSAHLSANRARLCRRLCEWWVYKRLCHELYMSLTWPSTEGCPLSAPSLLGLPDLPGRGEGSHSQLQA